MNWKFEHCQLNSRPFEAVFSGIPAYRCFQGLKFLVFFFLSRFLAQATEGTIESMGEFDGDVLSAKFHHVATV